MKLRATSLASLLALAALAGASGCADNPAVEIQAICAPPTSCTFKGKCDAQYIGFPTLDKGVSATDVIALELQLANGLANNADKGTWRVNTNDAHVDEVEIQFEGTLGGIQGMRSNYQVPAGGTTVVSVKMNLAGAAAGTVVGYVRMRGYFDDGTRFETEQFPIAVTVCDTGCAPAACVGLTCPPDSEGQRPLACMT